MPAPFDPADDLPEALEDAVLAILDGDERQRDDRLAQLMLAHPQHERALRRWLLDSGVLTVTPVQRTEHGHTAGFEDDDFGERPRDRDDERLPRRLGPYRLLAVLGRGGFGTVYRAEQLEPIRRAVAVKVLNPGMDSREILQRFAAEREALNRMDHAGIARLLDAGSTPKGRPYFVMELVEGPTLLAWCRRQHLPLRPRLALFLEVCEAMQHAHQRQVLHRDLSANNVLAAERPDGTVQPKIIDFGIAKSLADPLLDGATMTFQGTLMGTPEYMSPEQAAGRVRDIDTRADVYSLGVQLYELLTDQLPIPGVVLRAQGYAGIARMVATHEPARASDIAPKPRRPLLRGDLDRIVERAIAKDRDERYPGVSELAADVRRYLDDEPVEVSPPTTWYRLRKFIRRNRTESLVLGVAALGMIAALVVMALALREAHRQAELLAQEQQKVQTKSDEGFRLLANEERLQNAIDAEAALPPPWPEHRAAYQHWFTEFGDPLRAELPKVEQRLAMLQERALTDPSDRHLADALRRLQVQLRAFVGDGGPLAAASARLRFGTERVVAATAKYADRFDTAATAIKASDGVTAAQAYSGLKLPMLPGLVALGMDPQTKLWQFLDLATHAPDAPLPTRDEQTGVWQRGPEQGAVLVLLPPAMFETGAVRDRPGLDRNDRDAADDELHGGTARLNAFLIARDELTQAQWARLVGAAPPDADAAMLPAISVDWLSACTALRRFGMDLPTEAQWGYACRAGSATPWSWGGDAEHAPQFANVAGRPQPVGQLRANPFGLFDVHGNVAEWCRDALLPYADRPPRAGDGLRGEGDDGAALRTLRGGSAFDPLLRCRSTARRGATPDTRDAGIGLRPVRALRDG